MEADEFMREMLKNVRVITSKEAVCPKCSSKDIYVMVANNAVIGCTNCGNVEELLTWTEG